MKRHIPSRLALVMLGTLAFCGVALAQEPSPEFVVSSIRSSGFAHSSIIGASDEVISTSQRVSYADLNLATTAGSREMEARVRNTAKALCEKLEQRYPLSGTTVETCIRNTVDKGMADVRAAADVAEKKAARTASIGSRE
jgi:UrcA family protein